MRSIRKLCCVFLSALALMLVACGCDPTPTGVKVTADALIEQDISGFIDEGAYFRDDGRKMVRVKNGSFDTLQLSVAAGEKYYVSFATSDKNTSGVCGLLFSDENDEFISKRFDHKKDSSGKFGAYTKSYDKVQVVIPEGCANLYVNSDRSKSIEVYKGEKREQTVDESEILPRYLNVACLNCGQFDHDGSPDAYKSQWQEMIEGFECDLFMFEDSVDNYSSTVKTDELITRIGQSVYAGCSEQRGNVRLASSYAPRTVAIVPVDNAIAGSSKTTERCFAVRYTFIIGQKEVAFYGLHLVAEAHISDAQQQDGSSLSQKLRQKQFAQLIEDGKNYDECVFMGDFNCQRDDEYDIFRNAGFTTGNNGSPTLDIGVRDLPADNIIVSGGITLSGFQINTEASAPFYDVGNTDHKPLFAELTVA